MGHPRGDRRTDARIVPRVGPCVGPAVAADGEVRCRRRCAASTPPFLAALCDGLCDAGPDVVDLGLLPTPMICYARHRLQAAACAIVTASHHPADLNGLRWSFGDRPPTPAEVKSLQGTAASGTAGRESDAARPHARRLLRLRGPLQETFVDAMGAQCHVVLDPMHGCWAGRRGATCTPSSRSVCFRRPRRGRAALWRSRARLLAAGPARRVVRAVYRERAHLGIAFDGDGDRIAMVDNEGVCFRRKRPPGC